MRDSKTFVVRTEIYETDSETDFAVANATKWLIEEVGNVDTIQNAYTETWNDKYQVHFRAMLNKEQKRKITKSDFIHFTTK
jgi:hypothetical protein